MAYDKRRFKLLGLQFENRVNFRTKRNWELLILSKTPISSLKLAGENRLSCIKKINSG